ncbi:MAG TPA: universal stress protein [Pseudonocardia sp.]|jgi:nucleotide-binding universal stress UspA family protein|nr:universal stress protein [Pseudonocardia sp.]
MNAVRPNDRRGDGPGVILVAVDGSTTSIRAAAWAAGLARRQDARLLCVHVATRPVLAGLALGLGGEGPVDADVDDMAGDLEKQLREAARDYQVRVEFVVRSGDPVVEIGKLADEVKVDAVIVGASTHAGHRLVGSVAIRLVRAGRWPVTVVP